MFLEQPKINQNIQICYVINSPKDVSVFNLLEISSDTGYVFCAEETRN